MKIKIRTSFWIGVLIALFLGVSYFIKLNVDSGGNYQTYQRLLGVVIFENPFVLGIYVLIAVVMIVKGLSRKS